MAESRDVPTSAGGSLEVEKKISHDNDTPRIVLYQQTHHLPTGPPVSLLPLINSGVTHVIIAAIHVNARPGEIHLNDDPPSSPKFNLFWEQVKQLQQSGVKVLGMLGGAAQGSFHRLDIGSAGGGEEEEKRFNSYYIPLRDVVRAHGLDGLDLDVEEHMSLEGIVHLIHRLKSDFGDDFIITLAPVAPALAGGGNLSGFDYRKLESQSGHQISWYNAQFYNNWGNMSNTGHYETIVASGMKPARFVVGLSTNRSNANGYLPLDKVGPVLAKLSKKYPSFGGVMGWEYYNALPSGDVDKAPPTEWWRWAKNISDVLKNHGHPNP